MLKRFLVVLLLLFFSLIISACYQLHGCENRIKESTISIDQKWNAVIFGRDCGATTGFSTQISVIERKKKLPNNGGNVLVATVKYNPTDWEIFWESNNKLIIRTRKSQDIVFSQRNINGIKITIQQMN